MTPRDQNSPSLAELEIALLLLESVLDRLAEGKNESKEELQPGNETDEKQEANERGEIIYGQSE